METVDEALREYLLFRGFTHTLRTFEAELRHDKDKAFQVTTTLFIISSSIPLYNRKISPYLFVFAAPSPTYPSLKRKSTKIVNQIFVHVTAFELGGLCEFWDHLSKRFFSRLERSFMSSVRKLEYCLKRYYLVHAIQVRLIGASTPCNAPPPPPPPPPPLFFFFWGGGGGGGGGGG